MSIQMTMTDNMWKSIASSVNLFKLDLSMFKHSNVPIYCWTSLFQSIDLSLEYLFKTYMTMI